MLSQRFATKYVMKQFRKLISPFSTQRKIADVLTTDLKLDNNTIEQFYEDGKKNNMKISKSRLRRNSIILQKLNVRLEKTKYLLQCLMLSPTILKNRILVLRDIGIDSIDLSHIKRFPILMRKTVFQFKKLHNISSSESIMKIVFSNINIKVGISDDEILKSETSMRIGKYYQLCTLYHKVYHIKLYDKLFYKSKKIKYLSITAISKVIDVLINKCHFDVNFLEQHHYLLNVDVDNVEEFLNEFKYTKINDKYMTQIIRLYPRILLRDTNEIKELLQLLQNFKISNNSLFSIVKILELGKDTFLERYASIENNFELSVWLKHPRILYMIYLYDLVMNRLTYMRHLNCMKIANIHTYTSHKKFFLRFIEGDTSFTAIEKHLKYILRKELGRDKDYVMSSIRKHPHWRCVPLSRINRTIQYLRKRFSVDDICKNIHIIFYSMSAIDNILNLLYKEYSLQGGYNYTPAQYLALCVYKLEEKYHFNGDGIWQTDISVFNSNFLDDIYDLDNFVERISNNDNEVTNSSGAAWLEYLLQ